MGVEFSGYVINEQRASLSNTSSECFWGDVLQLEEVTPLGDCNLPCDGNLREICGGGGRILIYEDINWTNPTRDELADALSDYGEKAQDLRDAIQEWHDDIDRYNQQQQNTRLGVFVKRQGPLVTLEAIALARAQVLALKAIIGSLYLCPVIYRYMLTTWYRRR
jgi:hypothetical protein